MEQLRNIKLSTSDFDIEKLRDRNEQIKKYYDSMKQNPDYKVFVLFHHKMFDSFVVVIFQYF